MRSTIHNNKLVPYDIYIYFISVNFLPGKEAVFVTADPLYR